MKKMHDESGYAIAAILIFLVIATTVMAGWMKVSISSTRTVYANKVRNQGYGNAEGALNAALSWLRLNSQHMTKDLFSKYSFCSKFDRYANASYSANDPASGNFPVPTRIKVKGTNDAPLLVKCGAADCASLGTSSFPNSTFFGTVSTFDTVSQFAAANTGDNIVKVTLVDAAPENDAAGVNTVCSAGPVQTNFFPIYRVDAMTGNAAGSRVFGYVSGNFKHIHAVGFYGKDRVTIGKPCASDHFTGSTPDSSIAGPNQGMLHAECHVGSQGPVTFTGNWKSKVYGSVTTTCDTCTVDTTDICNKYPPVQMACSGQGDSCTGSGCYLPDPFAGLVNPFTNGSCPLGSAGVADVESNSYVTSERILNTPGCRRNVVVPANKKLTLTSTNTAASPTPAGYWFQNLNYGAGGGHAGIGITPNPANGVVELHIYKFNNEPDPPTLCTNPIQINGNGDLNISNKYLPSQLKLIYWGSCPITFLGNSDAALALYAPNAKVTVKGNSDYYGAIFAKELDFSDLGGTVIYDESMGLSDIIDTMFQLRNVEETYR